MAKSWPVHDLQTITDDELDERLSGMLTELANVTSTILPEGVRTVLLEKQHRASTRLLKSSICIEKLTKVLVVLTVVLAIMTGVLIVKG